MVFRQLFDRESSTYSYLMAERPGGDALLIDPVLERVEQYLGLMEQLDLRLVLAVDTHLHADHITGLGTLRERTDCVSAIGEERRYNPRLQVKDKAEYVALMNGLKLDNPRLMDIAVPANRACGLRPAPTVAQTSD